MHGSTGALGFVAINNADNPWSTTFMTGLPGGSYCNVIDGKSVAGVCTGDAYVGPDPIKQKKRLTNAMLCLGLRSVVMAVWSSPLAYARQSQCTLARWVSGRARRSRH